MSAQPGCLMAKKLRDRELITRIQDTLTELGPMTLMELTLSLKLPKAVVSSSLQAMRKPKLKRLPRPQLVYVQSWVRETEGSKRTYPRAVFALGAKADAPRPQRMTSTELGRRWRAKLSAVQEVLHYSSIFNLGRGPTFQGATMKLYQTTVLHSGLKFQEFSSSSDAASKVRTRLKKNGMPGPTTEEVDVPTTRNELVVFLNKRLAHPSHIPPAVAERLTETAGS